MKTVENWLQITIELLLLWCNSFRGSKCQLIMAEFTKVHKLQSSLLVFLSKQPRKEKILDTSREVGESWENHQCPSFEQNFLHKNCWVSDNQIQYSACPKDKWLEKFSLTLAGFKVPSSRPGKVNFLTGQVTFKLKAYLSSGQGSSEVIL